MRTPINQHILFSCFPNPVNNQLKPAENSMFLQDLNRALETDPNMPLSRGAFFFIMWEIVEVKIRIVNFGWLNSRQTYSH